jgi:D-amino-acid dehydrogenase
VNAIVIGGGVIGLTTAYHLAREGRAVTVVDARTAGQGASDVNAGWVVPACAGPVPAPGMVLTSLKWMLRSDSPLYIRPSIRPDFLKFMFGLWKHSNARDFHRGFEGHLQLARGTLEMFDEYRSDGMAFEMHSAGLLMAFAGPAHMQHYVDELDLPRRYGLEPHVLVGDDVRAHEPLLSDRVHGGIYFPHERYLDPGALVAALRTRLESLGVEIVEGAPIDGARVRSGRVASISSRGRDFHADTFVLAAGAWTGGLSRLFGEPLPVRPGKGYCIDTTPLPLRSATNLSDAKVAVTPLDGRLRLAGTMEFGGLDETINSVRVEAIRNAPRAYFRDWEPPSGTITPQAGMRPMTPDGLPIIGRLGRLANTYVSTGHGMLGVTLAPGTAAALTDLILHDKAAPALQPFSPARFRGRHTRSSREPIASR